MRSILDQSAVVWHSSLTQQNINDLERVRKSAMRIILGNEYVGYKRSLQRLEMDTLEDRRKKLCLNFAQKATKNPKTMNMFPENKKSHVMNTRQKEKFKVEQLRKENINHKSWLLFCHLLPVNFSACKAVVHRLSLHVLYHC